jgi:16S rRNA (adenine1518-N6/adenine1519-N6)-dimethyltransferase
VSEAVSFGGDVRGLIVGGYHTKKRLGQHFLTSDAVIARVVETIAPQPGETVVEIGPGQGVLTAALASRDIQVTAIEFDRDLIPALEHRFGDSENVTIINLDFLKWRPSFDRFVLVGNLPYNLTTPVMEWCVTWHGSISRAVFMVQRELAERLAAAPDSRAWSPISIFTQLCFQVELAFDVPPTAFEPPPAVVSSVISLQPTTGTRVDDMPALQRVVRSGFAQRRKLMTNNLTKELHMAADGARDALANCGLGIDVRAEQVTIEQFLKLTAYLRARKIV